MQTKCLLKTIAVGRDPKRTLIRSIVLAIICIILFGYFLLPVRMYGRSMEPRYRSGSMNFVNTLSYRFHEPRRGDVVAIAMAGRRMMFLKRIIGLPEETVAFRNGVLIIDGDEIPEPYLKTDCEWAMEEVKDGPDEYFVAGDNRSVPLSCHSIGRVKRSKIVGGVLF